MTADPEHCLRIVYLDDSEAQLRSAYHALKAAGHEVNTTTSVTDAAHLIASVDLVIIDFHMPDMNGAEALYRLRRHLVPGDLVLFYLYTSDREVATSFKSHGFDGAFTAKGDSDVLVSQVEAAARMLKLKRFRQQRER